MKLLAIILSILSAFFSNLETKTLQSDFSLRIQEDQQVPANYTGSITMRGQCFTFEMADNRAAYDGKTMYVYSEETEELTLTEPTKEELTESNPLLFAQAVVEACTVKEETDKDGVHTLITLVPEDEANIGVNRLVLKIRTSDLMPIQLDVREKSKVTTLKMTNPKFVTKTPSFTIEPEETTFVNDLRF